MQNENRYITPCGSAASDAAAIQAAVDEAHRTDTRTVVLFPKENGGVWELDAPVRLPNDVTLILEGAVIRARGIALMNEAADQPEALSVGGEQHGLHILGTRGAKLIGQQEPQLLLCNVREYTVRGLTFEGGAGIRLTHARQGRLQDLRFAGSLHGIRFEEGCANNLALDMEAHTRAEAVLWSGGDTTLWGRSPEICHSSLCRLRARTGGAPAVAVYPGPVAVRNLLLRDITDSTDTGTSVVLGDGGEAELRDVSLRGAVSGRCSAAVTAQCDGIYLDTLSEPRIDPRATRVLWEQSPMTVEPPQTGEQSKGPFLTANDPAYFADTDAGTLQNAVNAAARQALPLVIPRRNARTGALRWDIDRAVCLPANVTVVLLDAHLRQTDFSYTNLFINAPGAKNIRLVGVGSAMLDSGKPNGLKVKNAGTMGFGPITDNATVRLTDVDGFTVRGLHMAQTRWYSLCCTGCTNGRIADIDLYAPPIFPDLGGIRLHSGCGDIRIENITGLSGEDLIAIDGRGGAAPASHIRVRNLRVNSSRCCSVNLISDCCDVTVETLLDSSLPEQKKQPWAAVRIGQIGGKVSGITVRDVIGRGNAVVELGGTCEDVTVSNIHGFGSNGCALQSIQPAEVSEFLLIGISELLCEAARRDRTQLRNCRVSGVFFRCLQASRYMRGTATSIITDQKKFVGTVMKLRGVNAENCRVEHLLAERIGTGVEFTGQGAVTVADFRYALCGREEALCGSGCELTVNGQAVARTETFSL